MSASSWVRRVLLFGLTNVAVVVLLGIVMRLLGVDRMLGGAGYTGLLVFSTLFGFAGSFVSLLLSKWLAKRSTGARVILQPRSTVELWLVDTVRRLSASAGIGMPEVAVYDSQVPNAFATGARRDASLVAVSTGLLSAMDTDEVEAVLAHEISHVANGDMVTMALLQGVVNTFVIFLSRVMGTVVDQVVFRSERGYGPGYWITVIASEILLGLFATLIVMAYSRRREFRADAGAARLSGAGKMISALRALDRGAPADLPQSLAAFGIRGGQGRFAAFFASHPPIADRIAALERSAG